LSEVGDFSSGTMRIFAPAPTMLAAVNRGTGYRPQLRPV
jgi:hypothetical protein